MGPPDVTFLWSKTAESQLTKGDIWAEFAQVSFLPRYFRNSQLSTQQQLHTFSSIP
jgi:hypothetical protein